VTRRLSLALFAIALSAGCGSQAPRIDRSTPVILISIDTLRADRLPAYGYGAVATPAIDRLAKDGVVFDEAFTASPLTLPSHVTVLRGVAPTSHRIRDNIGYPLDPQGPPLLQQYLRQAGHRTGGFVSSFVLRRASGIAEGFEVYDDGIELELGSSLAALQRPGAETLEGAVRWLDGVAAEPFFLFLHVYEPHAPYVPPEPFASRYAAKYDGEVAAADDVVGRLLARLDALSLYDRALVVLISDHGEGLGEHEEEEHGVFLYRSTLHVPLIVKLPAGQRRGHRVETPVSLVDVCPTVLALVGLEPDPRVEGSSLLGALGGAADERRLYSETYYPRLHFGWSELFSVIAGRHHFIDAPRPELYDMVADPAETKNLAEARPELLDELRRHLAGLDRTLDEPEVVPAETLRALAALGYAGSAAAAAGGAERLPDPKLHIGALADLRRAAELVAASRYKDAVTVLEKLVAAEPQIVDAWELLGRSLVETGRTGEGLRVYGEALGKFPHTPLLALAAAELYFELGFLDRAEPLATHAADVDPAAAHALLARIALGRKDLASAERHARAAEEARDSRSAPDLAWAEVRVAQGKPEEAIAALDELEQRLAAKGEPQPESLRGLAFLRGKALASAGQAAQAEEAFMREIERFPQDPQAYTHLAAMYGLVGMKREAVAVIGRLLQVNGSPHAVAESIKVLEVVGAGPQAQSVIAEARRRYPDDPYLRSFLSAR
jgi:tetratricopeptide (TPR) repeat protein